MLSALPPIRFVQLGVIVGLVEALAIVRYDWLMQDWTPSRVLIGLAWALAIVAIDGLGWWLLGFICRWRALPAVILGGGLVFGVRLARPDRFSVESIGLLVVAVLAALGVARWPRLVGLVATPLAILALWGRIPSSAAPIADQLMFHALGALLGLVMGAMPTWGTTPRAPNKATKLATAAVLVLGAGMLLPRPAQTDDRPVSVLFVLVDTLRADHVAPYGDRATPSTQRLADEGLTLTDAITVVPKTTQSVAAFQTGKYPTHNGVRSLKDSLASPQQTLAELLADQGYRTGGIAHNPWVRRGRGFEQGFQQFWSFYELERAYGPLRYTGFVTVIDTLSFQRIRRFDPNTDAQTATDRALSWLNETPPDEAFYLYIHYFDPHWPYRPAGKRARNKVNNPGTGGYSKGQLIFNNPLPDEENAKAVRLYGEEVDHNADQVGRLLDWLDESGRTEDTLVVFTADHGHHLGDHDYWYHHGAFLYEPGLKVPMLMRLPGVLPAGSTEDRQFRSIDLAPSLLELIEAPKLDQADGAPLSVLTEAPPTVAYLESDQVFFKHNKRRHMRGVLGKVRGIRQGRWKLHLHPRKAGGGYWELYDLAQDPEERANLLLAPGLPPEVPVLDLVRTLGEHIPEKERVQLEAMGHRFDQLPPRPSDTPASHDPSDEAEPGLTAEEASMLEAMGYMDNH